METASILILSLLVGVALMFIGAKVQDDGDKPGASDPGGTYRTGTIIGRLGCALIGFFIIMLVITFVKCAS